MESSKTKIKQLISKNAILKRYLFINCVHRAEAQRLLNTTEKKTLKQTSVTIELRLPNLHLEQQTDEQAVAAK